MAYKTEREIAFLQQIEGLERIVYFGKGNNDKILAAVVACMSNSCPLGIRNLARLKSALSAAADLVDGYNNVYLGGRIEVLDNVVMKEKGIAKIMFYKISGSRVGMIIRRAFYGL